MPQHKHLFARGLLALGILSAVCLTASVTPTATAQAPAAATASLPAGVERVTSVEGITEYRLANGLQEC
jgi:zinc protease